jgi:hypothetical protein
MFEELSERVRSKAYARAKPAAVEIAQKIQAELPPGIAAEAEARGVRLSGRGLHRRWLLSARLRWLIGGALK